MADLSPDFRRLLRYGRGVDITRLVEEVGYRPRYSTPVAVADYVGHRAKHPTRPNSTARRGSDERPRRRRRLPRSLREGLDAGADLPHALNRAAGALPPPTREQVRTALRRLSGDYSEDEWGFDEEFVHMLDPLLGFLYDRWWRVKATGVENVPAHGRVLLAANHAGILPWDATMMGLAIQRNHPHPRFPRFLVLNWAFELPYVSVAIRRFGGVVASPYNSVRLLEQDHLVVVFPEGAKGAGKPFGQRYRLQRFGRGGFVEVALRTGSPIVPVAVVGSEEIYPKLGEAPWRHASCARPSSLSPRPSRGSARWAPFRCRRSGGSSSANQSTPPPTGPTLPTIGHWCSSYRSRCGRSSSARSWRTW